MIEKQPEGKNLDDPSAEKTASFLNRIITRRGALKEAAIVGGAMAVGGIAIHHLSTSEGSILPSPDSDQPASQTNTNEESHTESEGHHPSAANKVLSGMMATEFMTFIGEILTEKRGGFDIGTVAIANASLGAKSATLEITGHHKEAKEELTEVAVSYGIAAGLVVLAEAASHLRADNDKLFQDKAKMEALAHELTGDEENQTVTLPSSDANIEVWEKYHHSVKEKLVDQVAMCSAVSQTLAPLTTTYTSASIADQNLSTLYFMLIDHYYAQDLIKAKRTGQNIDHEQLKQNSEERALKSINGPMGYVNVALAGPDNLNGAGFLGDPPNFFFLKDHGFQTYLKASAVGLVGAGISTLLINQYWLAKEVGLGVDSQEFVTRFGKTTVKTLQRLQQSVCDGTLRDISFLGGRNASREIARIIEDLRADDVEEEALQQLASEVNKLSGPFLDFDMVDFVGNKLEVAKILAGEKSAGAVSWINGRADIAILVEDMRLNIDRGMALRALDETLAGNYSGLAHADLHEDLVVLARNLTGANIGKYPYQNGNGSKHSANGYSNGHFNNHHEDNHLAELFKQMMNGQDTETKESTDTNTRDLTTLIKIVHEKYENVAPSHVRKALLPLVRMAQIHDHGKRLLSHQAAEVATALFTQLAFVPSLVITNGVILPKLLNIDEKNITRDQFVKLTETANGIGMATSATADNAAAYSSTNKTVTEFAIKYFGEETFNKLQGLKEALAFAALLCAIAAGALTKYGNGPNMMTRGIDKEGNPVPLTLAKSMLNPYAVMQAAVIYGLVNYNIKRNLPDQVAV